MNGSKELYDFLMHKYGAYAQLLMLFEEQAELNVELLKANRATGLQLITNEQRMRIADELADNFIMLEQFVNFFKLESEVDLTMQYKLERVAQRSGYNEPYKDILPINAVMEDEE